jgi:hypothetical protein
MSTNALYSTSNLGVKLLLCIKLILVEECSCTHVMRQLISLRVVFWIGSVETELKKKHSRYRPRDALGVPGV